MKPEIQVFTCPLHAIFYELYIQFGNLGWFFLEDMTDLFFDYGEVTIINFGKHTQGKHVFAV